MRKGIFFTGLAILLIGLIGGILLTVIGFTSTDPASDNHYKISESPFTMNLDRGDYDIWYDGWILSSITIEDSGGNSVSINVKSTTESINGITKYGTFKISGSGQYTLSYGGSSTLYITDPISVGSTIGMVFGGICGGIVFTLTGIVLLIVGGVMKPKRKPLPGFSSGGDPSMKRCPNCNTMVPITETVCHNCYRNLPR